jgi:transketolase
VTTRALAAAVRSHALRMCHHAKSSHIGTCLSMADILAVLYGSVLRVDPKNPRWPERDWFFLSKGHGAAALYAVLAEKGFLPVADLARYGDDNSPLIGHASHLVPGVELSTGSLGHGLPVASGVALAGKREGAKRRVFCLMSDGELDEGSNWEAALFAPHHKLDNLCAVVDCNGIQSFGSVPEVLALEPLADKWTAFGWEVREVNGHDHDALAKAVGPSTSGKPVVVIARTVKGKGVSFMENQLLWHYRSPDDSELQRALAEVGAPR